jgi:ATP-dependent protease Clp ATPase subunit
MRAIAERAVMEQTGARGLMTVCEKLFRDFKFTLPDHPEVRELVVGRETVEDPGGCLEQVLRQPDLFRERVVGFQLQKFEQEFAGRYGVSIRFTEDASQRISEKALKSDEDTVEFCRGLFQGYEHGLKLLQQAPHKNQLVVDAEGVENPAKALEKWIKATYRTTD